MRRRALIVAIGAVALLVLGCGGNDAPIEPISSGSTSSTAGGVTQETFIASADSLCAEANAAIANLSAATTTASQERGILQGVLNGLQRLGTPSDPDGSLQSFYGALQDEIRILKQQEQAVSGGDTATADSLAGQLDTARSDAQDAGSQYGFRECGRQGTSLPGAPSTGTTVPSSPATPAVPDTTTPAPAAPADPAPATPPAPVTPAPTDPSGGSGGGTPTPPAPAPSPSPGTGGSGGSGSSGGVGPG